VSTCLPFAPPRILQSKRFFYHNVTVGASQWHRPKRFFKVLDPEQRREEEAIAAQARRELGKLEELAARAAKGRVQTSLGQRPQ
jgi:hypothetical protein